MSLLGNLRVRLTAETEDFRRGMEAARRNVTSWEKSLTSMAGRYLAVGAAAAGAISAMRQGIAVANQYDTAARQLAATARLTGVEFGFLASTAKQAREQFRLSMAMANGLTVELTKLTSKAGDLSRTSDALAAFLDIGAARGLDAAQTLTAVRQAILGIDEGTDKLFGKNPSVLYEEYARQIGTTAGRLTDQQKAQAILNAAMQDGERVRGEYQRWLTSSAGQQYLLTQGVEQTYAVLGRALQPALVAILPTLTAFANGVAVIIRVLHKAVVTMSLLPAVLRSIGTMFREGWDAGMAEWEAAIDRVLAKLNEIDDPWGGEIPSFELPPTPDLGGGTVAQKFFDDLSAEWERLRHSVVLRDISIGGTEVQRLNLEEEHQLRLLDIEEQHIRARHRLKELTDAERDASLRELAIRRQIAAATREQLSAAARRQEALSGSLTAGDIRLQDAIERARLSNQGELARLDGRDVAGRLNAQLALVARIHAMQREAILTDVRLSETQRTNELLKLDLAKEREEIQLRMMAATERELEAVRKAQQLRQSMTTTAASLIGTVVGGGKLSGAQVGSSAGTLGAMALGGMAGGPIGLAVGGALGGLLGGLFDRDDQEQATAPVLRGLNAIERAQRETISAIAAQTDALLNPESRFLNLPSTFTPPAYAPGFGRSTAAPSVSYGDVNVSMAFTIERDVDPDVIRALAYEGITDALYQQRRTQSWS